MPLSRRLHRLNAVLLGLFLTLHLGSHALLAGGRGAHLRGLERVSPLYANALVHPLLVALFIAQIALGLAMVVQGPRRDTGWARARVVSGLYTAFWLLQHVPAVIAVRAQRGATDTFFAAAVLRWPLGRSFRPCYVLAVTAVSAHVAAFARFRAWPEPPGRNVRALPFPGIGFGVMIVLGLAGLFGGPQVPETAI